MKSFEELMGINLAIPTIMTFFLNGKEIGRLVIQNNKLEFFGDADTSAKIFMDKFLKPLVDDYIKEKLGSIN